MCWNKKDRLHIECNNYEKVNENMQETNENLQEVIDDEVLANDFEIIEKAFDEFKNGVNYKLNQKMKLIAYLNNDIDRLNKRITAKDVMQEILPILSLMYKDLSVSKDCNTLKQQMEVRFEQLESAFSIAGIELKMHKPMDGIEENEKAIITYMPTADKELNNKVAYTKKILYY